MRLGVPLTETLVPDAPDLDIANATRTHAKNAIAISGAVTKSAYDTVGLILGVSEPRRIYLAFDVKTPIGEFPNGPLLGAPPVIKESPTGKGYAIIFESDDLSAGVTVSKEGDLIETLFCDARRAS